MWGRNQLLAIQPNPFLGRDNLALKGPELVSTLGCATKAQNVDEFVENLIKVFSATGF
jgi:hypothetical protein